MEKLSRSGKMVRAALLCAVLCVLAMMVIPLGPVPFSMAVLGVALIGAFLSPLWAAASVGCYILLGLCGLPVFSGFQAGPGVLLGPTGGYLAGYFVLALAISFATKKGWPLWLRGVCGLLGLLGCYLLGTLWFMVVTGSSFITGLTLCVLPFALPDIGKIALALVLAGALQKRMAPQAL